MSAARELPRMGFKFMLSIREGPDTGASFQLLPPRVSIGRSADNNIVLNDPRMSRNAAVIEFSMEKIVITDVSGRQMLIVNNEFCVEASIKGGDSVRLGETEMVFVVEAMPLQPLRAMTPSSMPGQIPQAYATPAGFGAPPRSSPPTGNVGGGLSSKQKFYFAVVGGLILVGVLLGTKNNVKKVDPGIRTVEEIEKEIKASQQRTDEIVKKRVFKNEDEKTRFREAQRHFQEGFRDFQKGQWTRAMRSFETARAIDPQHQLAMRYYKLAEKQRDELIALLTLEGRRYREKSMFTRCSAQFEKVLDLIPNKEDVKYKAAEQLKAECDQQLDSSSGR